MGLSKRVRFEVFKRDRFTCQYCGKRPPDVVLEVDHIKPRVEGGSDDSANLTTACLACNRGKAGIPLEKVAPALDEMEVMAGIQEMLERSLNLERSIVVSKAAKKAEDDAVNTAIDWWLETFGSDENVEPPSMRRFVKSLGLEGVRHAIEATERFWGTKHWMGGSSRNLWRYFCGVCWKMIRGDGEGDS
jgi:hypothetical protein